MMNIKGFGGAVLLLAGLAAGAAHAQTVYTEDFTGATTTNQWNFGRGACLTAGTGTATSQPNYIPGCSTIWGTYYSQQQPNQGAADAKLVGGSAGTTSGGVTTAPLDPVGSGALRFTNGYPYGGFESGAIVSSTTFNASAGVSITFKAVSYRGDSGGTGGDGADGMSFFLMDGSIATTDATYNGLGSTGGSLGYSCSNSNSPYEGLRGAYIGLGIDEYGNFLNGTTLYPGYTGTNNATGDNSSLGYGFKPDRIGLRGAGNVSWNYLNTTYPTYYPTATLNTATLRANAVRNTCVSGSVLDYSSTTKNYSSCAVGLINSGATFTANLSNGSPTITVTALTSGALTVGQTVTGTGIPGSTTITSVAPTGTSSYMLTLSKNANSNVTGGAITAAAYSAGGNCPAQVTPATLTANSLPVLRDYAPIPGAYVEMPSTLQIANESAMARPTGLTTAGVTNGNVFVYNLKITQAGLLSLSYSLNGGVFNPVITNQSITASNGALPSTLRFGFAGSTGGSTNIHEIMCFKAAPSDTSATSASTDQQQAGKIQTSSQAYFAYYNPVDWTGRMTAYGLAVSNTGVLTVNSLANWDAQCVLSGVSGLYPATTPTATCPNTGLTTPASPQSPTTGSGGRVMLTWNGLDTAANPGTAGIPFEWTGSNGTLTTAEMSVLTAGDTTSNSNRLDFLRGVRTYESLPLVPNIYRQRDGVLGDIIDSSPAWVGAPNSPYSLTFKDRLVSADVMPEGSSYTNFVTNNQSRPNVVYVGANDGFLHGFRTGTQDASGNISTSIVPNDGLEVLAYMPGTVLNAIHNSTNVNIDYSNLQYSHAYYVDATPGTGDLYYNGAWHTWLVGGLGVGGAGLYALDITNPSSTNFTEANAASLVIGDWSSATISCVNVTSCGNNLGNTYGTPLIRRLHNGMWGVIFGNGFASSTGDAGIYVMTVDASGNKLFYYFSTGQNTATTGSANGIAFVTAADLDNDHITDFVYAGDLQGNVWRFDLTSCTPVTPATTTSSTFATACGATLPAPTGWSVNAVPLFKTQSGQPITTPVVLASAQVVGASPSIIVSFGTGQRIQPTLTTSVTYASGTQSLYGVWDWNFTGWNSISATQYATLSTAQEVVAASGSGTTAITLGAANLQAQTFTASSTTVDSSNATVTWAQCSAGTPITCSGKFGWYANLPGTKEQVVSAPSLYQQALLVNSTVPASNSPLSCTSSSDSGFTYLISVTSGGTFTQTGTSSKASGFLNTTDLNQVGLQTNETGAITVINTSAQTTYALGQLIAPIPGQSPGQVQQIQLPANVKVNRATWTQIR